MRDVTVYEFSSGVVPRPNLGKDRHEQPWEFAEYRVGEFTHNSFEFDTPYERDKHDLSETHNIPKSLESAIRNQFLQTKTTYPNFVLTGRYVKEWAVLTVCDQLAGRANEVYRYFCVHRDECSKTPMLDLVDWYLLYVMEYKQPLRVDPDPNRSSEIYRAQIQEQNVGIDDRVVNIKNAVIKHQYLQYDAQRTLQKHDNFCIQTLGAIRSILSELSTKQERSVSWAINVPDLELVKRSNKFNLIQSIQDVWLSFPLKDQVLDASVNFAAIEKQLDRVASQSSKNLVKLFQLIPESQVIKFGSIFDDMGLPQKLNRPNDVSIRLLVLQGIFAPERLTSLGSFIATQGINSKQVKTLRRFESALFQRYIEHHPVSKKVVDKYNFCARILKLLYQGIWISLLESFQPAKSSKYIQEFLLFERRKLEVLSGKTSKDTVKTPGFWNHVISTQIRADFHEYIYHVNRNGRTPEQSGLSELAKTFFSRLDLRQLKNQSHSLRFLYKFWDDDPVILAWLHTEINNEIPRELYKKIDKLISYADDHDEKLIHTFFNTKPPKAKVFNSFKRHVSLYASPDSLKHRLAQQSPHFRSLYFK